VTRNDGIYTLKNITLGTVYRMVGYRESRCKCAS
jgi:hypothetical protein